MRLSNLWENLRARKPEVPAISRLIEEDISGPSSLCILLTYRCTATCRECCFGCSPYRKDDLPMDIILDFIDQCVAAFPNLSVGVVSGGECFLEPKKLTRIIEKLTSLGLISRCVTNGFWATSGEIAHKRLLPLREVGLKEINFSTNDDHQEWVPFERIVNGAIAAAHLGLVTVIAVDEHEESKFKTRDVLLNKQLANFTAYDEKAKFLSYATGRWVPFHNGVQITNKSQNVNDNSSSGCSSIFENITLTPFQQILGCCGLTAEYIPELRLSDFPASSIKHAYYDQFDDFLKIWLSIEGPENIFNFAAQKSPPKAKTRFAHQCEACAMLYRCKEIKDILRKYHIEKIPEIMFRFFIKSKLQARALTNNKVHSY